MFSSRTALLGAVGLLGSGLIFLPSNPAFAQESGPDVLPEVVVQERSDNLVGTADHASEGIVGSDEVNARPLLRPGEVLETVPGLVVSQHSGAGKANQYYLRGFNLDHGTDLAISVEGIPVNLRSNAHGQGYSDLNFLIPELISTIHYRKGSYEADQGDFSSAGSVDISYADTLKTGKVILTGGSYSYGRGVVVDSVKMGRGNILYGFEIYHDNGPWVNPDDYHKFNGVIKYSQGNELHNWSAELMGYTGKWNSTDQIPERAVTDGLISRFGAIDPSDGGSSHRYSFDAHYNEDGPHSGNHLLAYAEAYRLNLFSDFTYFLDYPETNPPGMRGDQFEQFDDRGLYGANGYHVWKSLIAGHPTETSAGLQFRYDDIHPDGLYRTEDQVVFATTRVDQVQESSTAPYVENKIRWNSWLRSAAGARFDFYTFNVNSSIAANSGATTAAMLSPKVSLAFGPWSKTDYYISFGQGFHSNDARGTTLTVDPNTLLPTQKVTPLVRSNEGEIGARTAFIPHLQSTAALWYLRLASELVFDGDAGTTTAGRPSERTGVEFTNYYTPNSWLTVNADYAYSHAHFTNYDPVGDHIPGAVEGVADAGVGVNLPSGYFGYLRFRYFGPRPLIEDNSVRSEASSIVNLRAGYRFRKRWSAALDVLNLFNAAVSDIDYYYTSRLPGEPTAGVNDISFHPAESRTFRVTLTYDLS